PFNTHPFFELGSRSRHTSPSRTRRPCSDDMRGSGTRNVSVRPLRVVAFASPRPKRTSSSPVSTCRDGGADGRSQWSERTSCATGTGVSAALPRPSDTLVMVEVGTADHYRLQVRHAHVKSALTV